jgi:integrase
MLFRAGVFYSFDRQSGKRESLRTGDKNEAQRLLHAKNEGHVQPALNLQLARTYLAASDPETVRRTWRTVFDEIIKLKAGKTKLRWENAKKDVAFDLIRERTLLDTRAEHFLAVLEKGRVSTNVFLRRIHNFCLDMGWLLSPVIVKRQWPKVVYREKRSISSDEHRKILGREKNPENAAFYDLCWHLGGSQSDVVNLRAEDIDWGDLVVAFHRGKTKTPSLVRFGGNLTGLLKKLPARGYLFPHLRTLTESVRADLFRKRCKTVEVHGVTLHSYRYAWAERAKKAGMPERFAMEMLGHNSKAISRAYSKKAQIKLLSLEEYETRVQE